MHPSVSPIPDLATFEAMVGCAYRSLPAWVQEQCANVLLIVADTADPTILEDLGLESPLELTGLYQGVPLPDRSLTDPPPLPDTVTLYRIAIIAEWQDREGVPLTDLVAHVLVHELAHHFGYSDDDIAKIDEWWL